MARTALVLGVNGQDGSYVAEAFLRQGIGVVGVGRDAASRYVAPQPGFEYRQLDLAESASLVDLLSETAPDFAVHLAAVHGATGAGFSYEAFWRSMMQVNVLALHALLEHARVNARGMRVLYAGSMKVFPKPLAGTINERTPMRADCLYSIGKIAARDLILQYRRDHGVMGTNLILFNHDSPRRPPQYFLPTVARALDQARRGRPSRTPLKTLDFRIDWSAADEFAGQMVDISMMSEAPELIMASGRTVYAREFIGDLFRRHGLDAAESFVEESPPQDAGPEFVVDISGLEREIGRRPQKGPMEVVADILEANAGRG